MTSSKKEQIIYFQPTKPAWQKKLSAIEVFHCGMTVMGGFYYPGIVDLQKFTPAMQQSLDSFDFLFSRLHSADDQIHASYKQDSTVSLEIEESCLAINNIDIKNAIPQKMDARMLLGVTDDIEVLPMAAFKLTQLADGFIIGYCLNHTFLDQSSIVYFFKTLSSLYSGVDSLKKPQLIDVEAALLTDKHLSFDNVTTFRLYANNIGLKYVPNISEVLSNDHVNSVRVQLRFDVKLMDELKDQSICRISKNDIVHAILLKVYAQKS